MTASTATGTTVNSTRAAMPGRSSISTASAPPSTTTAAAIAQARRSRSSGDEVR